MADDRSRPSIADGMIVIAAVAVALVIVRQTLPIEGQPEWARLALNGLILLADFLAPLSCALVVIRLRPPRPPIRRLARQPGFAACLAASVAVAASVAFLAIVGVFARVTGNRRVTIDILYIFIAPGVGFAVLGAWTTLAATGRWRRPAPGGLERAGWLVGWGWLSLLGIIWLVTFVFP